MDRADTEAAGAVPRPPAETVGELARMGIDPGAVGLEPTWVPPVRPAPPTAQAPPSVLSRPMGPVAPPVGPHLLPPVLPEDHGLVVPTGWRRLVRAATLGLVRPGTAAAMASERYLVAHVRARQRGPRTVAFVAGKGGAGTTTTAIGIALALATLRNDTTVLVDGRSGTGSIGRRVADLPAPTTLDLADEAGLRMPLANRSPLHLVDAPPWHVPADRARLVSVLGRLRDSYQFVAVDVGNDAGSVPSDQVVIVTPASAEALTATRTALGRIQADDPSKVPTAVVALVCLAARTHRMVARAMRGAFGLQPARVVVVPFDAGLVTGHRFDPRLLRPATLEAYLRLAALIAAPWGLHR